MYFMEMKHERTFLYLFILRTNESSAVKNTYHGKQALVMVGMLSKTRLFECCEEL